MNKKKLNHPLKLINTQLGAIDKAVKLASHKTPKLALWYCSYLTQIQLNSTLEPISYQIFKESIKAKGFNVIEAEYECDLVTNNLTHSGVTSWH